MSCTICHRHQQLTVYIDSYDLSVLKLCSMLRNPLCATINSLVSTWCTSATVTAGRHRRPWMKRQCCTLSCSVCCKWHTELLLIVAHSQADICHQCFVGFTVRCCLWGCGICFRPLSVCASVTLPDCIQTG